METISELEIERYRLEQMYEEVKNSVGFHDELCRKIKQDLDKAEEKLLIAKNAISSSNKRASIARL